MIRAILNGRLAADPQQKVSKASGKPFVSARIRVDQDGDRALYAAVLAFADAADRLAGLKVGDAIAASGVLKVEVWAPQQGEPRPNLTLLCDELLSVRRKPREHRQQHDDRGHGDRDGPPAGDPRWLDA